MRNRWTGRIAILPYQQTMKEQNDAMMPSPHAVRCTFAKPFTAPHWRSCPMPVSSLSRGIPRRNRERPYGTRKARPPCLYTRIGNRITLPRPIAEPTIQHTDARTHTCKLASTNVRAKSEWSEGAARYSGPGGRASVPAANMNVNRFPHLSLSSPSPSPTARISSSSVVFIPPCVCVSFRSLLVFPSSSS